MDVIIAGMTLCFWSVGTLGARNHQLLLTTVGSVIDSSVCVCVRAYVHAH
jgi:hypothetical protein